MNHATDELEKFLEKARTLGSSYAEITYQRLISERIDVDNKALKTLEF